ncbi:hypothetical protein BKA82DRAFT_4111182 [Pisolithus tinctorius]|nr:hypothetical protein BKA82DRAFT_4111182 [Pisolithus tinctorius]
MGIRRGSINLYSIHVTTMGSSASSCSRRSSRRTPYHGDIDSDIAKGTYQEPLQRVVAPGDVPPPYSASEALNASWHVASLAGRTFVCFIYVWGTTPRENALETLRKYDTVLIVDDSGSMRGALWEETYDSNGLDIHFLNYTETPIRVEALFRQVEPEGYTPIGERLEGLLSDYLRDLEKAQRQYEKGDSSALKRIKPVNFIVITDGCPTDDPASVIIAAARRLDAKHFPLTQVGIQFVQIGNSRKATAYLRELDDTLSGHYNIRDIVDTTPYMNTKLTSDMLIKILLGGIQPAAVMGL